MAKASSSGASIALVEGVDPLLDPDARRIGSVAVVDVSLGDRVRGRVDVEGEGRDAVLVGIDERVDARVLVGHPRIGGRRGLGRGVASDGGAPGSSRSRGRRTSPELLHAVATRAMAARDRSGLRMAQPPCEEPVRAPGHMGGIGRAVPQVPVRSPRSASSGRRHDARGTPSVPSDAGIVPSAVPSRAGRDRDRTRPPGSDQARSQPRRRASRRSRPLSRRAWRVSPPTRASPR